MRFRKQPPPPESAPEPRPEWEYVPEGWDYPAGAGPESVAEGYAREVARLRCRDRAPEPLGVNHETAEVTTGDVGAHNMLVSFGYVVARAARGREPPPSSTGAAGPATTTCSRARSFPRSSSTTTEADCRRRALARAAPDDCSTTTTVLWTPVTTSSSPARSSTSRTGAAAARPARSTGGTSTSPGSDRAYSAVVRRHPARAAIRLRDGIPRLGAEPRRVGRGGRAAA